MAFPQFAGAIHSVGQIIGHFRLHVSQQGQSGMDFLVIWDLGPRCGAMACRREHWQERGAAAIKRVRETKPRRN
jgi:hypothetical protein